MVGEVFLCVFVQLSLPVCVQVYAYLHECPYVHYCYVCTSGGA